ncbi:MAG TPA: DUF1415 domain-containing protein [Gammaproteobacteria bacterium]|jgi:hypothetical protein|nr:DUF1415 domain-containing protein [Gammaproteobacteria bacterium]
MSAELPPTAADAESNKIIAATRLWLERAVIGLNLCPFAKAVHVNGRIRYCVSDAQSTMELVTDLSTELRALRAADPAVCETTLLIHPGVLTDFVEYSLFLRSAERTVAKQGFAEEFQIASFHPDYQFGDAGPDDVENYTNRSPYPMLHLLRESSIERAVAAFPDAAMIYEKNIETLRRLGHAGWQRLWVAEEDAVPGNR